LAFHFFGCSLLSRPHPSAPLSPARPGPRVSLPLCASHASAPARWAPARWHTPTAAGWASVATAASFLPRARRSLFPSPLQTAPVPLSLLSNPSRLFLSQSEPLAAAIRRRHSTSTRFPAHEAPPPSPRSIQALPGLPPSPLEPPPRPPLPTAAELRHAAARRLTPPAGAAGEFPRRAAPLVRALPRSVRPSWPRSVGRRRDIVRARRPRARAASWARAGAPRGRARPRPALTSPGPGLAA
jgi:hypothetical protein